MNFGSYKINYVMFMEKACRWLLGHLRFFQSSELDHILYFGGTIYEIDEKLVLLLIFLPYMHTISLAN